MIAGPAAKLKIRVVVVVVITALKISLAGARSFFHLVEQPFRSGTRQRFERVLLTGLDGEMNLETFLAEYLGLIGYRLPPSGIEFADVHVDA
jgi:hypothetical protein